VVAGAPGVSRRRLIAGAGTGAAGAVAVLLSGCGANAKSKEAKDLYGQASEERSADAAVLDAALDVELRLAAVYAAIEPHVSGAARTLVRRIAGQEQTHAASLRRAIQGLGTFPITQTVAKVAAPRTQAAALELAVREENRAIAFYIDALPKLSADNSLRPPVSGIVTNEAEHLAVLAHAFGAPGSPGVPVVPQAFVQGLA
jgi:rubrerythrin